MVGYWFYYNVIFNQILTKKKLIYFLYLEFCHRYFCCFMYFLGWIFENEILTKLRRSYIVFFILFEILAQGFLIKEILF